MNEPKKIKPIIMLCFLSKAYAALPSQHFIQMRYKITRYSASLL